MFSRNIPALYTILRLSLSSHCNRPGPRPILIGNIPPVPVDLHNPFRSHAEEPPCAMLGPEPELAGEGHVPHDRPEPQDLLPEKIGDIRWRREDLWREPHADERSRGCRVDGEMVPDLRALHRDLDLPALSCNRDRFRQRPVRAGYPDHAVLSCRPGIFCCRRGYSNME